MVENEIVLKLGILPNEEELEHIDSYFCSLVDKCFSLNCIQDIFPNITKQKEASGFLAVKNTDISKRQLKIYFFRAEEPFEVTWAGNPNKPLSEDQNAIALSPRKSFEKWVEIKHGYSKPWSLYDEYVALKIKDALLDV
jgi:light-regulated signal transduction histidine kinase (bacteriophytochrome)